MILDNKVKRYVAILGTCLAFMALIFVVTHKQSGESKTNDTEAVETISLDNQEEGILSHLAIVDITASNPKFKIGESIKFFIKVKNTGDKEIKSKLNFQVDYKNEQGEFEHASKAGGEYTIAVNEEIIVETDADSEFIVPSEKLEVMVKLENQLSYNATLQGFEKPIYDHVMPIEGEDQFLSGNQNWKLMWNDEFNKESVDLNRWSYEEGHVRNYEPQNYTKEKKNSGIVEGNLVLTLNKEEDGTYSSASLGTKDKFDFKFGRVEVRAKLPKGAGLMPMAWMTNENIDVTKWEGFGQVNIFKMLGGLNEYEGNDARIMGGISHKVDVEKKASVDEASYDLLKNKVFADDYHVFAIEWTSEAIQWYVDDVKYHSVEITSDELVQAFNSSQYLNLSLAMSLDKGGPKDENSYPQQMSIDYIRVYQQADKNNGQVINSFFEEGLEYWSYSDEVTIETRSDLFHGKAAKIAKGNNIEQEISGLHPYSVYELHAKVYSESGVDSVIGIKDGGLSSHVDTISILEEGHKEVIIRFSTGKDPEKTKIYVTNNGKGSIYINNVEIRPVTGIVENIINGSFEVEEVLSFQSPNNRAIYTEKNPYSGKKSAYLPSVEGGTAIEYNIHGLLPYSTYTVTAMVKQVKDDGNGKGSQFGVRNNNGSRAQFVECKTNEYSEYKEVVLSFTTGKVDLDKILYFSVGHRGEAYIDDVILSGPGIMPVYTEKKELFTAAASILPLDMMKTPEYMGKEIEYELELPDGFTFVGKEALDVYRGIDRLLIQLPKQMALSKYALRVRAICDGERLSESFLNVNIVDDYEIGTMTAKVANTSLFKSYEVVVPITNKSTSNPIELTLQGISHKIKESITLIVEPSQTEYVLLTLDKFPKEERVRFKVKVSSQGLKSKVFEQVLIEQPIGQSEVFKLTFNDEFEGHQLDSSKWNYNWVWGDTCAHSPEIMKSQNVKVEDGKLLITGSKEGDSWYSGMVQTNGIHHQQYGYWEAKIKTVNEQGFLNAFWMCTAKHWPPEIDVVEVKGNDPFAAHMTMHYKHTNGSATAAGNEWKSAKDLSKEYTIFGCRWTPEKITYYVNGAPVVSFDNQIHEPLYTLLNMHIGMDWTGAPVTNESQTFYIDWVRIWKE